MINLGALVNLTDVHGSTPFMDVLTRKNQTDGVALYARINNLGKVRSFPGKCTFISDLK